MHFFSLKWAIYNFVSDRQANKACPALLQCPQLRVKVPFTANSIQCLPNLPPPEGRPLTKGPDESLPIDLSFTNLAALSGLQILRRPIGRASQTNIIDLLYLWATPRTYAYLLYFVSTLKLVAILDGTC